MYFLHLDPIWHFPLGNRGQGDWYGDRHNQWVRNEIEEAIKSDLETSESKNTTRNLWDSAKAVQGERFLEHDPIYTCTKKKKN